MALNFAQKETIVAEVAEVAKKAYSAVGAEYRGLTVAQMTQLRVEARKAGVYVRVGGDTLQFGPTFNSKPQDLDRLFDAVGEALNQID